MNNIEKIKEILAQRVDVSKLTEETELTALGLDSLDLVEVSLEIEEALNIKFELDEIESFKTLKNVLDCVNQKTNNL